ncbi:50S ribosomal protein L15 [Candidatus Uhrbacteria bacterium]|nr:50S ribosomal protein L15 [Candidatus Uhrbacteria bacterium]
MNLHTLKPFPGSKKRAKRVGRGHGSAHGTTATRGTKGQRARSGGSKGLKLKGMKQMLLRIPKVRGFKSIHPKNAVVNLDAIEKNFSTGETVSKENLLVKKLIAIGSGKNGVSIKILGTGELSKKLSFEGVAVSSAAKEKIEKAGGVIQ